VFQLVKAYTIELLSNTEILTCVPDSLSCLAHLITRVTVHVMCGLVWPIELRFMALTFKPVQAVTRTSVPGVAPIHFPPRSRLLPIPGRLRAHTHAIPILADRTPPLPLLVVLSLITFPSPLYYICSPDPRLAPLCPSHFTCTNLIISRVLYLTVGS
jgi:hypothetical protein